MIVGRWLVVPAFVACAWVSPAAAEAQPSLQPYQMVRSLQLLQDRIAAGDHAALPLQNKLLELIDGRFRAATDEDFAEKRNVRAAIVYGMSGGNPKTLLSVLNRPSLSEEDRKLGKGVLAYLQGSTKVAQSTLVDVEPETLPTEVGAFLALVKGSVTTGLDEKAALRQFDLARLLGPGTLVEEAALRRSLAIEASLGEADRFFLASAQYVRRFLRSPYASQFADSFVTGILALHAKLDYESIDGITALMDADQRKVIYLRLARRAAIEGLIDLSSFASKRAAAEPGTGPDDPRSQLYSSLSTLTSENIEEIADKLKTIDRQALADSDIRLLDAAERVVNEVTARPAFDVSEATPAGAKKDGGPAAHASANASPAEPHVEPPAEAVDEAPEAPSEPLAAAPPDAQDEPTIGAEDGQAASAAPPDAADQMVTQTRARLSAIDKLLEGAQ